MVTASEVAGESIAHRTLTHVQLCLSHTFQSLVTLSGWEASMPQIGLSRAQRQILIDIIGHRTHGYTVNTTKKERTLARPSEVEGEHLISERAHERPPIRAPIIETSTSSGSRDDAISSSRASVSFSIAAELATLAAISPVIQQR